MTREPLLGARTAAPILAARPLASGLLLTIAALLASSQPGHAACRINVSGAKCESAARFASASTAPALPVAIGEPLPYEYMMLLNSEYFGLPPVSDGWVYFRVGNRVVRADYSTREVLEDVTGQTNRAFF
ncbi:hypothetical protein [Vannielia litorea]|uniref:Uncharacterized protein n=1 Tax=Vannielia litorea TaxID=1217970 RepID=A0A1N6FHK7_9RHOB|nr:hypothetical protein [Vannielia litorea]SIN94759.1 hypothetical protein SAMN05444002_1678 [Vannielia litorea]